MPKISANNVPVYYETSGSGLAVVFIHSFLCDGSLFEPQVQAFQSSCKVITVDIRGHGRSGAADSAFSIQDIVKDVLAVLDKEHIGAAVWVGLSIGGFVAMRAALDFPKRVKALVLLDTEAGPQSLVKKIQDIGLKWGLRALGPKAIAPSICNALFGKSTRRSNPALVNAYKLKFQEMRVESVCHCIDAVMNRDDLRPQLSKLECPTLVVVGDEDVPLPVAKSREIAQQISTSRLAIILGAGHLSAIEQPIEVNRVLAEFLGSLD
jgi:3-oxoadipate enol-lactonase